ncbi:hypothetical protein BDQ17DRAFT_1374299 [Cyathus striatus]|nr:hypothetical protein BDQ17DRAFT_1374299 [Cyathus striatus]
MYRPFDTLPLEIKTKIFTHLPVSSLPACLRTSQLQYIMEKEKAGVEDKPINSVYNMSQKLNLLMKREKAWKNFDFKFHKEIEFPRENNGYTTYGRTLSYLRLPKHEQQQIGWRSLDHDLIALACRRPETDTEIEIILRSFSSLRFKHPLGKQEIIKISSLPRTAEPPSVDIAISGENLVVCVECMGSSNVSYHAIYTFNWITGQMKFKPMTAMNFQCVAFLRPDVFVKPYVPREKDSRKLTIYLLLNYWRGCLVPFVTLGLPSIDRYVEVTTMICCGDPKKPFRNRTDDSLILFTIELTLTRRAIFENYLLVVHRSTLWNIVKHYLKHSRRERHVKWSNWGPKNTRWFSYDGDIFRDPCSTSGGRFANPFPHIPGQRRTPERDVLQVMDFGLRRVRDALGNNGTWELVADTSYIQEFRAKEGFREAIYSSLPYIVTSTRQEFNICGEFLDEERVMFIRVNMNQATQQKFLSCVILYIG